MQQTCITFIRTGGATCDEQHSTRSPRPTVGLDRRRSGARTRLQPLVRPRTHAGTHGHPRFSPGAALPRARQLPAAVPGAVRHRQRAGLSQPGLPRSVHAPDRMVAAQLRAHARDAAACGRAHRRRRPGRGRRLGAVRGARRRLAADGRSPTHFQSVAERDHVVRASLLRTDVGLSTPLAAGAPPAAADAMAMVEASSADAAFEGAKSLASQMSDQASGDVVVFELMSRFGA